MKYVGLQTQIWRNNIHSIILLIGFPLLLYSLLRVIFIILGLDKKDASPIESTTLINDEKVLSLTFMHIVIFAILIWFIIAWFSHNRMIAKATGARMLGRNENMRVYNLVENLCISRGMKTPIINIIEDDSLNAYASGINEKTYTVALSRGIINKLNDEELEAVIAHELTHIRNRDVRLLIISIIFVGIFAFIAEMAFRSVGFSTGKKAGSGKKGGGGGAILLIILVALIAYLISITFRFAISRKREYMADAGAAELTKNPKALASALRKISRDPMIEAVKRDDVAQLFIEHPKGKATGIAAVFAELFATHPPIEKRIQTLEQF